MHTVWMEEFNKWNMIKKSIQSFKDNKKYHAGDVWWCSLGKNIGFEQNGTGKDFERPILVLKGFNRNVCMAVPLTTQGKDTKFYKKVSNNNKNSYAILSQIRLLDTKRFVNKIGHVDSRELKEIKKAIWDLIR